MNPSEETDVVTADRLEPRSLIIRHGLDLIRERSELLPDRKSVV